MKHIVSPILIFTIVFAIPFAEALTCMSKCPRGQEGCVSQDETATVGCAVYRCTMKDGYTLSMELISNKCRSSTGECVDDGSKVPYEINGIPYMCTCKVDGSKTEYTGCEQRSLY
ncbi:uncharacterized protein [Argopecten irradians]|uniref:uncharacterized protein n=1 Tax=Argopecten irradians TaxID=31199 RepID=UPI0037230F50